jgi:prepilin-type N-terminal cleavage/methylation domain-containing protein
MKAGRGFSLIELLIVVAIILTISAIAIPRLIQSRIAANEAAAVSSIRTLTTAEHAYAQTYPDIGFTCSVAELGPPGGGGSPNPSAAGIVDAVVASGVKQGYTLSLSNCGAGGGIRYTFSAAAVPVSRGSTGMRAFCSDASGIIWYAHDGTSATCQSGGVVLQ